MEESIARPRRGNGEGSLIFDEKRGRWRGAVSWTQSDGTLKRRAFSSENKAVVKKKMAAVQRELEAGRRPASPQTLAEYLTAWLDTERARVKASTWRYREGHVRLYIIPALGRVRLADLQPRDIERLTSDLVERGLSARTAVGVRVSLRKALADAERDGLVGRNVAALARPPRVPGREVEFLTKDGLRRLLDACVDDGSGPLITVAALTGLRQGELLGLSWSDLDTEAATLTVRRALARSWADSGWELAEPKTARSRRTVHLPPQALVALQVQRGRQEVDREAAGPDVWQDVHDLVFTDAIGRPRRSWDVTHDFHRLLEGAGLRSVPFHALRHSWATLALSQGVPLKVIADNLGHASIVVTATFYSGLVPELGRDAADAVGRALA